MVERWSPKPLIEVRVLVGPLPNTFMEGITNPKPEKEIIPLDNPEQAISQLELGCVLVSKSGTRREIIQIEINSPGEKIFYFKRFSEGQVSFGRLTEKNLKDNFSALLRIEKRDQRIRS